ncbi:MAG: hypothetical protein AAGC60_17505 [Acidobacteriota bacterium]
MTSDTTQPVSTPKARAKTSGFSRGQTLAAALGGTLTAFAIGLAITIFVPGHDGLDEAFLGGLTLAGIWPVATLWILFAPTARRAWLRGLLPAVLLLAASAAGLLL